MPTSFVWIAGYLILISLVVFLIFYIIYWTDILIFWSDPVNAPKSLFYNNEKWSQIEDKGSRKEGNFGEKTKEKYLVIGCGFCGMSVCASLKRHGIPFDACEKNDKIGGNWYNGVYETVHIISSKKTTEYKDFPMPESYPDFPSAKQMQDYFDQYCKHYRLYDHISFNTNVKSVEPIIPDKSKPDFHHWKVILKKSEEEEEMQSIYKGIIIANGHHWDMRIPSNYKGLDQFKGEILHSKQYKSTKQLQGKKVLVVGGGNSACDIATESARFSKECHISLRRGYWFMPRVIAGLPLVDRIKSWMPMWFQRMFLKFVLKVVYGSYESYGLQLPDHDIFEHHPTINSELLNYIKLGKITPHHDIESFSGENGKTIKFKDGSEVQDVDLVIFCTGYHSSVPLLKDYLEFEDKHPKIYGHLFVPNYSNVFCYGFGQPRYGAGPLFSFGSEVISTAIQVQEKLSLPMWKYMSVLSDKIQSLSEKKASHCQDILLDPHRVYKFARIGKWIILALPFIERILKLIGKVK